MTTVPPPKPFLSIEDQISLLSSRGMVIDSREEAAQWLRAIGYYRLSGYWYPFREVDRTAPRALTDHFVAGTTFREVVGLYEFDRHLKNLLMSGLERVEVAMRSQAGYTLGSHGPLAYKDPAIFRPEFCTTANHTDWLATAERRVKRAAKSNDATVVHHIDNYGGEIPIWVLTDVLDFSDLSMLFGGMTSIDQKKIMDWFGITRLAPDPDHSRNRRKRDQQRWNRNPPLANWLLHLTIVRNICAHHGRLWNRQLTPIGVTPTRHLPGFEGLPDQSERVYGTICLIAFLLNTTSPGHTWTNRVGTLVKTRFSDFALRSEQEMGFPSDWKQLPLWQGRI
ncbi:Abi family protein [Rhodococcus erythropolis]